MKLEYSKNSLIVEDNQRAVKFKDDQICYESDEYVVRTCGYFLNMDECLSRYSCKTPVELILQLIEKGEQLPKVLHGAYLVVLFIKKSHQLYLFNDLLSKHSLYYYEHEGDILVSDSFLDMVQMVKQKKLPFTIDSLGVKMMLWHRMFYDNLTYIREIKFLRPFEYLVVNNGKIELKKINFPPMIDVSIGQATEEIHRLFNKAVKLQFQKNEKEGFYQITTLSGGMDSRSTFLYGLANGYTNQFGFCYGESTSVDYEYSQKLATKHHCYFYFHAIDNGDYLLKRDEMCKANEGQMLYAGSSGVYDSLNFYDTSHWGIVHTGLGGGEIMGDMRVAENPSKMEQFIESLKYRFGKGKKDRTWASLITSLRCTEDEKKRMAEVYQYYGDFNLFQSLNDIRRCLNGQKIAQSFGVEYVSPFLDEDFFSYMLQIPYSMTKGRSLYVYWQKKYNPKQFETPSTFQMGCREGNKLGYYAIRFHKYVMNKMGKKTKHDMVPIEHWMANNPSIGKTQQEWFEKDMNDLKSKVSDSLYNVLMDFWDMNASSRLNILTATWILNYIYKDSKE